MNSILDIESGSEYQIPIANRYHKFAQLIIVQKQPKNVAATINMSEQANVSALQEELRTARSYARALSALSFSAVMLMTAGFLITFFFPEFGKQIGAPILGISGATFFPLGAIGEWRANKTKMNLIKKLAAMSVKILACSNCKKEVLPTASGSCPFCGKTLKQ